MMSSVDVIVPCYRYGHFLRQCVESVLAQAGPAVRVLIIDDASPDDTAHVASELAKEDQRVTFLRHRANKGHIATYNEGIDWVSGTYLLLLSADDYLLPGALSRSAAVMDRRDDVGFVFGNVLQLHDDGTTRVINALATASNTGEHRIMAGREFIEQSGATNIVRTPTAVVRTELQKQLGGYRPDLPHSGDMEMWLRLAARASVGYVDACQAVYRRHTANMSAAYMASNSLPDVRQRKAALDCLFEGDHAALPHAPRLRRTIFYSLGCEAVSLASAAFNEREFAISKQLCEFAVSVSPEVRRSRPWLKLACKRTIGSRAWRVLQAAFVDTVR
jgi:hypothetical protein